MRRADHEGRVDAMANGRQGIMIGLLGLDHETTSAEARGRLSFADERLRSALDALIADEVIDEVVILSTCNRTELYLATQEWSTAETHARRFLAHIYRREASQDARAHVIALPAMTSVAERDTLLGAVNELPMNRDALAEMTASDIALDAPSLPPEIANALYTETGVEAARRLFRVAAGLLSMVVGEAQILGQVREALTAAEAAHTVGDELRALFTGAIKAGKRARSETELGRADASVAALAAQVAAEALGGLRGKHALLIGAGRTNQLCAQLLRAEGVDRLTVANRTVETAATLAGDIGATPIALAEVGDALADVDLVISATAAPYIVLAAADVARGLALRPARATSATPTPLVILDLAVPPDVEATVGALPNVRLYTLDALRAMTLMTPRTRGDVTDGATPTPASLAPRAQEVAHAERIVEVALREYLRSRTMRLAVPGIAALRAHVDSSEQAERARALAQLPDLTEAERAIITRFGERLVDKMFHHLVARIRSLAEYDEIPPEVTMRVLAQLFADPDARSDH